MNGWIEQWYGNEPGLLGAVKVLVPLALISPVLKALLSAVTV
jgi:hypothetical protein